MPQVLCKRVVAESFNIFKALYEVALENLELSGTANRAAAVIICQLSSFLPNIFCKAFKQFSSELFLVTPDLLVGFFIELLFIYLRKFILPK